MVLAATLSSQFLFAGQIFFDVRFDSPLNQTNEPPPVDTGRETPGAITSGFPFNPPIVVRSSGHLTNQPLLFKAVGYQQIRLDNQAPVFGGFSASHGDVFAVRMGLSPVHGAAVDNPDIQVAVDNILIGTSVPPPPPTIVCSLPTVLECIPGAAATLHAIVSDSAASPLTVIWNIDEVPYQTNQLPAGTTLTPANLSFAAEFGLGEHQIVVSASNGQTPPAVCSTTVTVRDTTPPNILNVKANPTILWPPDHRTVPVQIQVDMLDSCGVGSCRIVAVQSNETGNQNKDSEPDWAIRGDLAVDLRAESSHEVAAAGITRTGAYLSSTRFGNCGQIFEARMDRSPLPPKKLMTPDSAQVQTSLAPASK